MGSFIDLVKDVRDNIYTDIQNKNEEIKNYTLTSENASKSSLSAANFKGKYSDLSGGLSIPASVSLNGEAWLLDKNLHDVTQSVPSLDNSDWILITKGTTTISTVAKLKSLSHPISKVWLSGYHTKGDGAFGSHIFEWDATSTEDDNGGTIFKLDNVVTGRYKLRYDGSVNVKWFGIFGVVGIDYTDEIIQADSTGLPLYFGNGEYLFNGENLTFSGTWHRESEEGVVFKNNLYEGNIAFDRSGKLIGLHHNHLEQPAVLTGTTPRITTGNIVKPPISNGINSASDVIGLFYNDFGLDSKRDQSDGVNSWYSWQWNFTTKQPDPDADYPNLGYQPNRHPLLGWYRGDDVNVLDWQSYWLKEAGINTVVVQCAGTNFKLNASSWWQLSDVNNWIYKLATKVQNKLAIIPWVDSGRFSHNYGNTTAIENIASAWDENIRLLNNEQRLKIFTVNGKTFVGVYMFNGESLRGDLDNYNNAVNLKSFFKNRADYCKTLGFYGIAILARSGTGDFFLNREEGINNGYLYINTSYSNMPSQDQTSNYYDSMKNWSQTLDSYSIPCVWTERYSSGHPSNWTEAGSDAKFFTTMVKKALASSFNEGKVLNAVVVYNVSEWAEGGASLQPTVGNGWKYLDAISEAINESKKTNIRTSPSIASFYKPTSSVWADGLTIGIGSDYNQTFTFANIIEDGRYDGEQVYIFNYNPVPDHTIALADDTQTAGTNLFFKDGTNKSLPPYQGVRMMWISSKGWVEVN